MKSSQKTSVIAAAVGEGYNQVCNRGVAYNAQYAVTQTGAEVCLKGEKERRGGNNRENITVGNTTDFIDFCFFPLTRP